jgi:3,4-dihydroxy 2-butanone 4-phosphate synthase / GTP cyclohydrolase II
MPIQRVNDAIEAIRNGRMVVMIDDEDRENEGDLVYAAAFSTPELVNFMAKEGRGLICATLTKDIADRLELRPMVDRNNSQHETAFTVSVDAATCTTGISAGERDMTIKILADSQSNPAELVKPGHIFPLIAKDGGTLVRTGHTEGSVDICRLAGVAPVAVICEIMKEDGEMARRNDLEKFAHEHNLKIVFISDIVEFRLKKESLVKVVSNQKSEFFGNECTLRTYQDHFGKTHYAYSFGEVSECANVKFHNIAPDNELLTNHSKFKNLLASIEYLKNNGGTFVMLSSDNQENGEMKEFGIGAQILVDLGIKSINLIASSVHKEFVGIAGFGLTINQNIAL